MTRICETEDMKAEEDHLRTPFRCNGYPEGFITNTMKLRTRQEAQQIVTESFNPRIKTLCMLYTVCKGNIRQDSRHLQEGQTTTCIEDYMH